MNDPFRRAKVAAACVGLALATATPAASRQDNAAILAGVGDAYWQMTLEASPFLASAFGLPVEAIPYVTPDAAEAFTARIADLADRLEGVDAEGLTHGQVLDLETLRWQLRDTLGAADFYWYGFEVTPYFSPLSSLPGIFLSRPLTTPAEGQAYLALLAEAAAYTEGMAQRLQGQRRRGILIAKPEIEAVVPFVRAAVVEGEASPYWPASDRLAGLAGEYRTTFLAELGPRVAAVNAGIERLAQLVDSADYRAEAPDQVGAWVLPGGEAWYRHLVRSSTTMDVTPEQVHAIGLEEVARINRRMAAIREQIGFEGTKADFHRFLKTDARFFPESVQQIHDTLLGYAAEMEEVLDDLFLRRPEAPYGVKRLEPAREPAMTFGIYEPPTPGDPTGYYRYNGSQLDQRSLLFFQALTYHELAPGHHFQINLQTEHESLPPHRRYGLFGAFTEGWGDYSAELGVAAGLYDDPYDMYGRLSMDMFISTRLVVDTGMSQLRWPRSRALRFMRDNLLESETQILSETLRYAVDIPGQALAYKMGARALWDLRARAEEALGQRFDVRRFHEAVIGSGAMPMGVLRMHVDWFIEQERARPGA